MNERAIKLYEQATEFAYETIGKEHANTSYFQGTIAGKFAELIVKECAVVAHNTAEGETTYGWMVGNKIKEHFGVEE